MALVAFADGTSVDQTLNANRTIKTWVSPSTMDSNDTVVLPTITGKAPIILSAYDTTLGASITASVSTQTVTLDAAGGATDQVFAITYMYV